MDIPTGGLLISVSSQMSQIRAISGRGRVVVGAAACLHPDVSSWVLGWMNRCAETDEPMKVMDCAINPNINSRRESLPETGGVSSHLTAAGRLSADALLDGSQPHWHQRGGRGSGLALSKLAWDHVFFRRVWSACAGGFQAWWATSVWGCWGCWVARRGWG